MSDVGRDAGLEHGLERAGFCPRPRRARRRAFALIQLIAAAGLVASLVVAATAVSIGFARAHGSAVHSTR